MSHTPGKLARRPDAGQWNVSTDECGMSCYESIQDDEGTIIGFVVAHKAGFYQEPNTEANARRLVACWNACEGLATEFLEDSAIYDKPLKTLNEILTREADSLRAVNAELAAALVGLDEAYCRAGQPLSRDERFEDRKRLIAARAAVASASKQGEQR